jgi:hypothetical protein
MVKVIAELLIATVFWYLCERPFVNRPMVPKAGEAAALITDGS